MAVLLRKSNQHERAAVIPLFMQRPLAGDQSRARRSEERRAAQIDEWHWRPAATHRRLVVTVGGGACSQARGREGATCVKAKLPPSQELSAQRRPHPEPLPNVALFVSGAHLTAD